MIKKMKKKGKQKKGNLTPVDLHGQLSVHGKNIVDEHGKIFVLRGVSTHGIGLENFHNYVNQDAFNYMRDEWGINVVRLALYPGVEWGNNENSRAIIKQGVEYAKNAGIYVVIDWHVLNEGDPNVYKSQAITYFQELAKLYKKYNNVIYEICNEPNSDNAGYNVTWNDMVKPYAEDVIQVIRKIDQKAIIAVGSSALTQDLDKVIKNPITNYGNIVYTMHFYAATHKDNLRNKLKAAVKAELPILISEFGACCADGNGAINYDEAIKWMVLLKENNIGFIIWQLSNKFESTSLIRSGVVKYTGWAYDELAPHGRWFVDMMNIFSTLTRYNSDKIKIKKNKLPGFISSYLRLTLKQNMFAELKKINKFINAAINCNNKFFGKNMGVEFIDYNKTQLAFTTTTNLNEQCILQVNQPATKYGVGKNEFINLTKLNQLNPNLVIKPILYFDKGCHELYVTPYYHQARYIGVENAGWGRWIPEPYYNFKKFNHEERKIINSVMVAVLIKLYDEKNNLGLSKCQLDAGDFMLLKDFENCELSYDNIYKNIKLTAAKEMINVSLDEYIDQLRLELSNKDLKADDMQILEEKLKQPLTLQEINLGIELGLRLRNHEKDVMQELEGVYAYERKQN